MRMRFQDVFVPGGFPRHTYNPRVPLQLEDRLSECRDNLCKLVTVTGQTKSGKTVLARKILPPEQAIWVDGGAVACEDDFWHIILHGLDMGQTTQQETTTGSESTLGAKGEAGADFLVVKGKGEISGSRTTVRGSSSVETRELSSRVTALKGLRECSIPLVIDDFHYLPNDLQGNLVRALKPLIFDGLPVVIIAIPHRRYDAMKVEREMTGRIMPVEVPVWSLEELQFIPTTGFQLLGGSVPPELCARLASESIGSPHLMQDFCRSICQVKGESVTASDSETFLCEEDLGTVFARVADSIGRPMFEKLARGPRQRTDRVRRELKDGLTVDIYQLVLHALAHLRPGLVSLEYEDLSSAIRDVSATQIPQLHEVARVLKHMATIAASDRSSTPVIDFEEADKKLHITDPFFAFFLRWGDIGNSS